MIPAIGEEEPAIRLGSVYTVFYLIWSYVGGEIVSALRRGGWAVFVVARRTVGGWRLHLDRFIIEVLERRSMRAVDALAINGLIGMNSNIFPSLMVNPSQDYEHLKQRRGDIQSHGYKGLRAPSSRARRGGNLIILFDDQSSHVHSILPYAVEFWLIAVHGAPFINHAQDLLDFTAGEVRMPWTQPAGALTYQNWKKSGLQPLNLVLPFAQALTWNRGAIL
jgi:hypothetical protein